MKNTRPRIQAPLAVLGVLAVLAGCQRMAPEPVTPNPEPVASLPTHIGTWTNTVPWYEDAEGGDDELVGERLATLTFTESRWIYHRIELRSDGSVEDEYTDRGGWTATDTYVEQMKYDDGMVETIRKEYAWANSERSALLMKVWHGDQQDDPEYLLYTRATDAAVDLVGKWINDGDYEDVSGRFHDLTRTFEIGQDGSFTYMSSDVPEGRDYPSVFELVGTYEHNTTENTIVLTVASFTRHGGEPYSRDDEAMTRLFVGQVIRWAYAVTNESAKIQVSPFWHEQQWDEDTESWVDNANNPYGNYWMTMEKES